MNRSLKNATQARDNKVLKTAESKITTEHLSIAVTHRDYSALCLLLLKTLGRKVEENNEIKHFLKDLFLGNSDEKSEDNKDFISEFLRHVIGKETKSEILKIVLNILGENAKDIITMPHLSLAVRTGNLDIIKDLVDSLGEGKAQFIKIMSYPLSLAIILKRYDITKYLVAALGEKAKDKIGVDHLLNAIYSNNHEILAFLVGALGENARKMITTEHLSMAPKNSSHLTLSLLLRTLGTQDEHEDKGEDKVKSFVQTLNEPEKSNLLSVEIQQARFDNRGLTLLLSLSDENNQRMIEIQTEHLNIAIENNDGDTLILLLETLGEDAKQMLSVPLEQAVRQANRDNRSRLDFLLTTLGENTKDMIMPGLLSLAKQVDSDTFQYLAEIVSKGFKSHTVSSPLTNFFHKPNAAPDSKERENATLAAESSPQC